MKLDAKIPSGPLADKWDKHRFEMKLVNPANKRKYKILVVGTGLAGGSAAASLAELGYNVETFCFQDSPRRAHSHRRAGRHQRRQKLSKRRRQRASAFFTTLSRAAISAPAKPTSIGSPKFRSISSINASPRACRSPANTAASSTTAPLAALRFRARFIVAGRPASNSCSGLTRPSVDRSDLGRIKSHPRTEMLDLVVIDGQARGIITRDLVTGKIEAHSGDAVILATGGYGPVFYLSTNAMGCNVTATYRALQARGRVRQPLLHANPSNLHPRHRRPPVEADADVGIAA